MLLYNLRFGWWNTALSPSAPQATTRADANTYPIVCNHIKSLLQEHSCDFLALCEVSNADVAYFKSNLNLNDFSIIDLTDEVGRTRFDMAVIYNKNKVSITHVKYLSKVSTGSTIKAAQVVKVKNNDDSKTIYVYLCHWASRLNGDGEKKRIESARLIYESASELMADSEDVIIMGDFNDNPYDYSLHETLRASRCHDAVIKYPTEFFYNPFWRSIVSEHKHSHIKHGHPYRSGSHKYKEFLGTIWHSYDQAIVSGSFLSNGYWSLNEYETKVMSFDSMLTDYDNKKCFIDHLPIVCEIIRP